MPCQEKTCHSDPDISGEESPIAMLPTSLNFLVINALRGNDEIPRLRPAADRQWPGRPDSAPDDKLSSSFFGFHTVSMECPYPCRFVFQIVTSYVSEQLKATYQQIFQLNPNIWKRRHG